MIVYIAYDQVTRLKLAPANKINLSTSENNPLPRRMVLSKSQERIAVDLCLLRQISQFLHNPLASILI